MPNVGDIRYQYGRTYVYTQPDIASGPGTWRPANPDAIAGNGDGSGGGAVHIISGKDPIKTSTIQGNPTRTTISLDIAALTPRV